MYITGALPNTYSIIIDDNTGRYGQLYGKNITGSGTVNFQIDSSSEININTIGGTKTYTNIMNGFTFVNSSGTFTKGLKNFSWSITGTSLTVRLDSIFCYNKDTTVLCLIENQEVYVPIQELTVGMLVKTYKHGYLPLKYLLERKNTVMGIDRFNSMYLIKKFGSMTHDLYVTGKHNILVDSINDKYKTKYNFYNGLNKSIDDKLCLYCCHYKRAMRIKTPEYYDIYHLILDGPNERYGIYVNGGFLSESTSEKVVLDKLSIFKNIKG